MWGLSSSKGEATFISFAHLWDTHYLLTSAEISCHLGAIKNYQLIFLSCTKWAVVLHITWGVNLYQYIYFKMVHIYTLSTITWLWSFGCKNISNVKQVDTIMHQHFWYLLTIYKSFVRNLKFKMASPDLGQSDWRWGFPKSVCICLYSRYCVPKQPPNTPQFECHRLSSRAPSWIFLGKFLSPFAPEAPLQVACPEKLTF